MLANTVCLLKKLDLPFAVYYNFLNLLKAFHFAPRKIDPPHTPSRRNALSILQPNISILLTCKPLMTNCFSSSVKIFRSTVKIKGIRWNTSWKIPNFIQVNHAYFSANPGCKNNSRSTTHLQKISFSFSSSWSLCYLVLFSFFLPYSLEPGHFPVTTFTASSSPLYRWWRVDGEYAVESLVDRQNITYTSYPCARIA